MKKIVLFAANGFIGRSIIDYVNDYQTDYKIVAVSRKPIPDLQPQAQQVLWDGKTFGDWTEHLEGADLIINLTGKSVNCRYTEKTKRQFLLHVLTVHALSVRQSRIAVKNPPAG